MRLIDCLNKAKDLGYTTLGGAVRYFTTQLPDNEKTELEWEADFMKSSCRYPDGTKLTDDTPVDVIVKIINMDFYPTHYAIAKRASEDVKFARRLGEE